MASASLSLSFCSSVSLFLLSLSSVWCSSCRRRPDPKSSDPSTYFCLAFLSSSILILCFSTSSCLFLNASAARCSLLRKTGYKQTCTTLNTSGINTYTPSIEPSVLLPSWQSSLLMKWAIPKPYQHHNKTAMTEALLLTCLFSLFVSLLLFFASLSESDGSLLAELASLDRDLDLTRLSLLCDL